MRREPWPAWPAFSEDEVAAAEGVLRSGKVNYWTGSQGHVLRHRFGLAGDEPMTLREVGELHQLSRERIRQLQERALQSLRREFRRRGLVDKHAA